jgi:polysaccharide deacetylase family protein (PEP-CTERM system associated)
VRVINQSCSDFREDIKKTKAILEDIGGEQVLGYRAASYSIGRNNLWAFDELKEAGYIYSSSIYPIQHDHYGFPEAPRFCFRDEKTGLIEIPISTVKVMNKLRPAGGGGFFRFYPYAVTSWAVNQVNKEGQSTVFYLHPWELDPTQPRQKGISAKTRFRHYLNLDKTESRLIRLLKDFNWGTMSDVFIKDKTLETYKLT